MREPDPVVEVDHQSVEIEPPEPPLEPPLVLPPLLDPELEDFCVVVDVVVLVLDDEVGLLEEVDFLGLLLVSLFAFVLLPVVSFCTSALVATVEAGGVLSVF